MGGASNLQMTSTATQTWYITPIPHQALLHISSKKFAVAFWILHSVRHPSNKLLQRKDEALDKIESKIRTQKGKTTKKKQHKRISHEKLLKVMDKVFQHKITRLLYGRTEKLS